MAFEVGIGGNIDGLKKSFKEAADASKKFESSVLSSAVKTEAAIAAANKGGVTMGKFSAQSNQAAFALNNLGRVAQDAPFGFIGIQNNLNPLLESFQQLRKEAGSNVGALKALGASLVGPAGIGLALSVVSSALLFYQQYQQKANKETKAAADANKELADSIKSIEGVMNEGRKNASKDLSALQTLYNATQNLNIPQTERLRLAKELIERYPTYLKGLTDEDILAGKATTAYQKLTAAIYAKGIVQAGEENRQKLINQQLNLSVERSKEQVKLNKALEDQRTKGTKGNAARVGEVGGFFSSNEFDPVPDNAVQKAQKNLSKLDVALYKNKESVTELDGVVENLVKDFGAFTILGEPDKEKTKKVVGQTKQDLIKELDQLATDMLVRYKGFYIDLANQPTEQLIKSLQQTKQKVREGLLSGEPLIPLENVFGKVNAPAAAGELYTPFEILKDEIEFDLLPSLGDSFENFFENILEKGEFSFKALGDSIKKTFASVLANEATQELLNALGQKGKRAEGKGGLIPALMGVLGKGGAGKAGSLSEVASSTGGFLGTGATAGTGAKAGAGLLGGLGPGVLVAGGALIAGSLIKNIVDGINKKNSLPNLYGPDGSSFIGESRSRGNDLLQTWYRTEKRKGR